MAKFFLTNNHEWYQRAKERINASDFKLAFDYAENGNYALTTHKLKLNNVNAVRTKNGEFAIATGTAIYKESLDYLQLLKDFDGDISATREDTIGQYAYIVNKSGKISIFGDRTAAYDIFYYIDSNGEYFCSNALFEMVAVIRDKVTLHELNMLEYASTFNIFCDETIFQGVYRLNGRQCVIIDNNKASVRPIPKVGTFKVNANISVDEATEQLAKRLKYKAAIIAKVLGAPTILMTGGLDSRLSLAAYLSNGVKPRLLYGRSNTFLASPVPEDLVVISKLAQQYSLHLDVVEWDTRHAEKYWDLYLNRYGFLARHWGSSKAIYDTFEGIETHISTGGLGGEMYRSNEFPVPDKEAPYTSKDITEAYGQYSYRTNYESYRNYPQYRSYIENKFDRMSEIYKINPRSISSDDIIYFNCEFNKFGDTFPPNLLNQIRYAPYILFEADCVDCAMISAKELEGGRLMLKTMEYLVSDILTVDFCTRCRMHVLDRNTMTLIPISKKDYQRTKFEILLKSIYLHGKNVLKPIRDLYVHMEQKIRHDDKANAPDMEIHIAQLRKSFISYELHFVDPRPDFYYRMLVNTLEKLDFPYKEKEAI